MEQKQKDLKGLQFAYINVYWRYQDTWGKWKKLWGKLVEKVTGKHWTSPNVGLCVLCPESWAQECPLTHLFSPGKWLPIKNTLPLEKLRIWWDPKSRFSNSCFTNTKRYQVLQQNTCTEVNVSSSSLGTPAQLSQSGLQILVLHWFTLD